MKLGLFLLFVNVLGQVANSTSAAAVTSTTLIPTTTVIATTTTAAVTTTQATTTTAIPTTENPITTTTTTTAVGKKTFTVATTAPTKSVSPTPDDTKNISTAEKNTAETSSSSASATTGLTIFGGVLLSSMLGIYIFRKTAVRKSRAFEDRMRRPSNSGPAPAVVTVPKMEQIIAANSPPPVRMPAMYAPSAAGFSSSSVPPSNGYVASNYAGSEIGYAPSYVGSHAGSHKSPNPFYAPSQVDTFSQGSYRQ